MRATKRSASHGAPTVASPFTHWRGKQQQRARANATPFGLAAGLFTRDLARAHRVAARLEAGTVWVNNFDTSGISAPFGGYKESGFGGKDKSLHALDKYTNIKTTWINLGRGGV